MLNDVKTFWSHGLYKNGFVLANDKKLLLNKYPDYWLFASLPDGHVIAYDPENTFVCFAQNDFWVCLCGTYCMDTEAGHMNMQIIAENLTKSLLVSDDCFYEYLDVLNGRFVCIISRNGKVSVLNDATASRSVYYSTIKEVVASHYNLVYDIIPSEEDPFWKKYCEWVDDKTKEHKPWPWVMPGDRTPWANIKILPPNHKIILSGMQLVRFYPRHPMPETNIDSATEQIAQILTRETETLAKHYKIYQSLTAGSDTRITLAAMKKVAHNATFFTYRDQSLKNGDYESEDRLQNLEKAKEICSRENLDFQEIIIPGDPLSDQLKDILGKNHYHRHIPQLLQPYSKLFTNKSIHLRSNLIEIIRGNEHAPLNTIDADKLNIGEYFASLNGYNKTYKYAEDVAQIFCQYYLDSALNNLYDYPMSQIFFWEYRLGNWLSGAAITENDLACDTFQLFNCRKILNIGLALPVYYRNRSIIYDKLIKRLWPELLNYGLPNQKGNLFDYINHSEIKGGQIAFNKNIFYCSGNIYDSTRKTDAIFEPYGQGVTFGFSANKLLKGDYCGFKTNHVVNKDINYFYQIEVKSPWVQGAGGGIIYELLINGNCVYKMSTVAGYFVNQIRYSFKATESKNNTVELRLRAEKDFRTSIYNGTIDVRCLELKRDYSMDYSYTPTVIDTIHLVKEQDEQRKLEALAKIYSPQIASNESGTVQNISITTNNLPSSLTQLRLPISNHNDLALLDKARSNVFSNSDQTYLDDHGVQIDIENIKELPNGRFQIKYKGVTFDCLFHSKPSAPLYVVLSGAKANKPPEFRRWSWYNVFNGNMLCIADPSYLQNEKLYLGWYYGNKEFNYRKLIADMVIKLAKFLKVKTNDIYFYGSSGGGTAAIHCAGLIENSTAIAINAQIFLDLYPYAPYFQQLTGIDFKEADPWHRQDVSYYLFNSPQSNFLLVENIQSPDDSIQFYMIEKILKHKFHYGINRLGNLGLWLYDAKIQSASPHSAQESQTLYFAIDYLAKSMKTCTDWEHLEELYLIISELWRTQWQLRDSIAEQQKKNSN